MPETELPPPIQKLPFIFKPADLKDLMPASPPYPPLPKFLFEPVKVEVSIKRLDYVATPPTASLRIKIYERMLERGLPSAPFTVYLDDEKIYSGKTDMEGEADCTISFKELRTYTVKVVLFGEGFRMPSGELTVAVFKGELYDGGACWWWIGRPYCKWLDEEKPSPGKGQTIWFISVIKNGSFHKVEWENTLSFTGHVDHFLTSPSGRKYTLWIPMNDQTLAPGKTNKDQMGSCVAEHCMAEPTLESLNETGTWKLTVEFYGTSHGTGPVLLDSHEVTFKVG